MTKPATTLEMAPIKTNPSGIKKVHFIAKPKTGTSNNTKTVVLMRKTNSLVVNIEVESDDECLAVSGDCSEITLTLRQNKKPFFKTLSWKKRHMMNDTDPICKHCKSNQLSLEHQSMSGKFELKIEEMQIFKLK